jgi:hypothetical protein
MKWEPNDGLRVWDENPPRLRVEKAELLIKPTPIQVRAVQSGKSSKIARAKGES